MGFVDWTAPSGGGEAGVDHLGMRVAGEVAYSQFFDFTTTVSWRPRYFSFWCSALRRAFIEAGGQVNEPESKIDLQRWRAHLRRQDHAIAIASLLADPAAQRIAGSDHIHAELGSAPHDDARVIALTGEHLGARNGSLSIYLGPMLQVGLIETDGVVHRPGPTGTMLADAFDAALAASGMEPVLSASEARIDDLRRLGALCGITRLSHGGDVEFIAREREVLRTIITPPLGADHGRLRVLSIGLLLDAIRRSQEPLGLDQFREYAALGGKSPLFAPAARLPVRFDEARNAWQSYQTHAFATLALEGLLAASLSMAFDDGPAESRLGELLVDSFADGAATVDPLHLGAGWSERPVNEVVAALLPRFDSDDADLPREPTLARVVSSKVRAGRVAEPAPYIATCIGLFLVTVARMRWLDARAPDAWLGSRASWRLPPRVLLDTLDRAIADRWDVRRLAAETFEGLVLGQHRRNALRKLEADPSLYTARFVIDEGRVVVIGLHGPGTSNPRVENALSFLADLGYVMSGSAVRLTDAGTRLLASICEATS